MIKVEFQSIENSNNKRLKYVVIVTRYMDDWIFVRHKDRSTWEIPGGHIEAGETPDEAAKRELKEETGALKFSFEPIIDYSVTKDHQIGYGRLYYCNIKNLGDLEGYEIIEVIKNNTLPSRLTYQDIQPHLFYKVKEIKGM